MRSSSTITWVIYKRYSAFYALHQQLLKAIPTPNVLPPLPPKRLTRSLAAEFVEKRKSELSEYLRAVVDSPLVSSNAPHIVLAFLEVPDSVKPIITNGYANAQRHVGVASAATNIVGGVTGGAAALNTNNGDTNDGASAAFFSGVRVSGGGAKTLEERKMVEMLTRTSALRAESRRDNRVRPLVLRDATEAVAGLNPQSVDRKEHAVTTRKLSVVIVVATSSVANFVAASGGANVRRISVGRERVRTDRSLRSSRIQFSRQSSGVSLTQSSHVRREEQGRRILHRTVHLTRHDHVEAFAASHSYHLGPRKSLASVQTHLRLSKRAQCEYSIPPHRECQPAYQSVRAV